MIKLLTLINLAMSLMALTESALPNSSFFARTTTDFTVPWLALTCGLNAIVTILISGRIIYYTRLASANGTSSRSSHTSIVAILIESAFPFTILGILCAVYFGKQQAPELAFAVVWGSFVVRKVSSFETNLSFFFFFFLFNSIDFFFFCSLFRPS